MRIWPESFCSLLPKQSCYSLLKTLQWLLMALRMKSKLLNKTLAEQASLLLPLCSFILPYSLNLLALSCLCLESTAPVHSACFSSSFRLQLLCHPKSRSDPLCVHRIFLDQVLSNLKKTNLLLFGQYLSPGPDCELHAGRDHVHQNSCVICLSSTVPGM